MYIAFYNAYDNESWLSISKWIAIFSRGKYSHCELVTSYGRSFSMSPKTFTGRFTHFNSLEDVKNYDKIRLKHITKEQETLLFKKIRKYNGAKYDWFGALFSIFNTCKLENKNKYFCSEVIIDVLKSNIEDYKWLPDGCKTSPVDLYRELCYHK